MDVSHAESAENQSRLGTWLTLCGLLGLVLALALSPGAWEVVTTSAGHLFRGDVDGLAAYLGEFGERAWLVSSGLMVLQSLAAPIPALPITITNALIYGPWIGSLVTWCSSQLAAIVCLYIARGLGRPFVVKLFPAKRVAHFDAFFESHGVLAIFLTRLIPALSFDLVSYAAGLTRVRLGPYLLATGLGQLPAVLVYSWAAHTSRDSLAYAGGIVFVFVAIVFVVVGVVWWRRRVAQNQ